MKILYKNGDCRTGIGYAGESNKNAISKIFGIDVVSHIVEGLDAIVYHEGAMPNFKEGVHWNIPKMFMDGLPSVGYWVIEGDEAVSNVDELATGLNQVWTPSLASKDALIKGGLTLPIKIIPHVLQPAPINTNQSDIFTILTCAEYVIPRKGHLYALEIFTKAFPIDSYPEVKWIIKLRNKTNEVYLRKFANKIKRLKDNRIKIICEDIEDMENLYSQTSVLLHPHMAGAFELNCAEAAIRGIPVIATNTGGPKDYLLGDWLIKSFDKVMSSDVQEFVINHSSQWEIPDVDSGAALLKDCFDNYSDWKKKAVKHSEFVKDYCDEERVGQLMFEALKELPKTFFQASLPYKNYDVIGSGIEEPKVGIASHRRSGTHFIGETIATYWDTSCYKTHKLPDEVSENVSWVYIVRNPIDCIFKTFKWFSEEGGCKNPKISEIVSDFTFDQYLDGYIGKITGFRKFPFENRDNLSTYKGGFLDPIAYWENHVLSYLATDYPIVIYEELCANPNILKFKLLPILNLPIESIKKIEEPVGHAPSMDPIGSAIGHWPQKHLDRLKDILMSPKEELCGDSILKRLGFDNLQDWINLN